MLEPSWPGGDLIASGVIPAGSTSVDVTVDFGPQRLTLAEAEAHLQAVFTLPGGALRATNPYLIDISE